MKLLKEFFEIRQKIHDYFGYKEDWVVIPLDDITDDYWYLEQTAKYGGSVRYADSIEKLMDEDAGDYYESIIYTQRFLPKFVYEAEDYTMISIDTQTDGNKFLAIFDNSKRVDADGNLMYPHEFIESDEMEI